MLLDIAYFCPFRRSEDRFLADLAYFLPGSGLRSTWVWLAFRLVWPTFYLGLAYFLPGSGLLLDGSGLLSTWVWLTFNLGLAYFWAGLAYFLLGSGLLSRWVWLTFKRAWLTFYLGMASFWPGLAYFLPESGLLLDFWLSAAMSLAVWGCLCLTVLACGGGCLRPSVAACACRWQTVVAYGSLRLSDCGSLWLRLPVALSVSGCL